MMLTVDEYMALRRLIDSERESEGASMANRTDEKTPGKPKRKRRKNTAYSKAFKKVQSKYKKANGQWKKGGFGRAVKEAHKLAKKVSK